MIGTQHLMLITSEATEERGSNQEVLQHTHAQQQPWFISQGLLLGKNGNGVLNQS